MPDSERLRLERIADLEGVARLANERVMEAAVRTGDEPRLRCECANDACRMPLNISREDYERVRADPMLFILRPSHFLPEAEDVVETGEGYEIVRKREDMRAIVEASYPRS